MKRNVEFKNFAPPQKVRGLIERLVQKVEKRAKIFPPDEVFLCLMIERNPRALDRVSLRPRAAGENAGDEKTCFRLRHGKENARTMVKDIIRRSFTEEPEVLLRELKEAIEGQCRGGPMCPPSGRAHTQVRPYTNNEDNARGPMQPYPVQIVSPPMAELLPPKRSGTTPPKSTVLDRSATARSTPKKIFQRRRRKKKRKRKEQRPGPLQRRMVD